MLCYTPLLQIIRCSVIPGLHMIGWSALQLSYLTWQPVMPICVGLIVLRGILLQRLPWGCWQLLWG